MKKFYILVILLSMGITQIYAQCYQCTGTNNPQAKLDVSGDLKAGSADITNTLKAKSADITGNIKALSAEIDDITTSDINATNVTLTDKLTAPNANVEKLLINTNNASTKAITVKLSNNEIFSVQGNGTVRTKEMFTEKVEVKPNAWSDHVFYPDYELRSLPELEQYIKQNGTLPEIPSEKEVKENGIDLGDMQSKLLLKIEELTLYILQQEKKMADMQNQINELKK